MIQKYKLLIPAVLLFASVKDGKSQALPHNPAQNEVVRDYNGNVLSEDAITSFIQDQMNVLKIPGASVAIINDGTVAYHDVLGFSNKENGLPVTNLTIFEAASISKPLFAFFVMKFVEEGKLDLDKPLYEYLPYPDIEQDERYKEITARMVLSHRAGFPNWRENEEDGQLRIYFEPGTDYLYSGEGYQYLAMVLKHIEETDWPGLEMVFQEKIAAPIGLEHTFFIETPYIREHKAEPYDENGKLIDWKNGYWYNKNNNKFVAASSLHTEGLDFAKWMIAFMNKKILNEVGYKELLKIHSPNISDAGYSYTLGFTTVNEPENQIYFHNGNNTGFTSMFLVDIKKKWGIVLFTNSEMAGPLFEELFFKYLAREGE